MNARDGHETTRRVWMIIMKLAAMMQREQAESDPFDVEGLRRQVEEAIHEALIMWGDPEATAPSGVIYADGLESLTEEGGEMSTAIDRARRTLEQARRRHDRAVPPTANGHINLMCPICKLIDQTVPELASMVEEAGRLLRELEHSRYAYECDLPGCPVCSAFEHEPHTDWCSLGRWLEGVR